MANGCATCGGGAGVSYAELQRMGPQFTNENMVLVRYIGTEAKRYFMGVGSRQRYPFGTCVNCQERYVLREDLGGFLADPTRFVVNPTDSGSELLENNSSVPGGDGSVPSIPEDQEAIGSGV